MATDVSLPAQPLPPDRSRRPTRGSRWSSLAGRAASNIVPTAIVAIVTVVPVGYLAYGAFRTAAPGLPGGWTTSKFNFLASHDFVHLLYNTTVIAVGGSALGFAIAVALAVAIVRMNIPGARWLDNLVVLPAYLPAFLVAVAWISLASPTIGYLNSALARLHLPIFNIYSMWGLIWVTALCSAPVAYLYIRPALLALDAAFEEAAWVLGSGKLRTIRLVVLRLTTPALLSALLVIFVTALSEFAVPAVLGPNARIYTLASEVYTLVSTYPADPNKAAVLGMVLVLVSSTGIILSRRITKRDDFITIGSRASLQRPVITGGPARIGAFLFCLLYLLVAVALPLGAILVGSLQRFPSPTFKSGWTLKNYTGLAKYPGAATSILNTLELSILAGLIGVALSVLIARMGSRRQTRLKGIVESSASLPIAVPHIVFGLALVWMWISLHNVVQLYGTKWMLLVAYVALFLPFGVRASVVAFQQIDPILEEAGRVFGASRSRITWRIVAPLMAPALLSGGTIITYHAMRELSASLLLYTPGNQVLSVQIWSLNVEGNTVELLALGLISIVLVLGVVACANRLLGSRRRL
jgi:iron(III) transport system permease protein